MAARRVLVVGSGGREHALAWRLSRDAGVSQVLVAPGNDAMGRTFRRLPLGEGDAARLVAACRSERIDLVVVGPEAPLAEGLVDVLSASGVTVFGPSAEAARIETSKWFAKQVLRDAEAPTARAARAETLEGALRELPRFGPPWVIKADGLAAGKGVCVARERGEAEAFLRACLLEGRFGESGRAVVLEEFLEGQEVSVMAVCDGERFALLPAARDYKRAWDGDRGPNTGGMGAMAPSPVADESLLEDAGSRILAPVLRVLAQRGTPFRGTLYAGLMVDASGPRVLEFNCRFGDPETQVVMPLVQGSLAELLTGAARGALDPGAIGPAPGAAVGVALVDEGYPDRVRGGGALEGLEELGERPGVLVFHAATAWEDGVWRVRGGRAAHLVGCAETIEGARARVYEAVRSLTGEGWRFRGDIAKDAVPLAGSPTTGPSRRAGSPWRS